MATFFGILLGLSFLAAAALAGVVAYSVLSAVFSGPRAPEKGLLAAVIGLFFFGPH